MRILGNEVQTSARKALEVFKIYSRDSKVNRKVECLHIAHEPKPCLNLAF